MNAALSTSRNDWVRSVDTTVPAAHSSARAASGREILVPPSPRASVTSGVAMAKSCRNRNVLGMR